ncbi:putative phosphoribosyl transferase [Catenulispora sp. MAP12-49]|uniref:phosphoribosyltransferase family protein n=1 Tax=unclassified Catenulispora TaxID=414885 RepID=UPI003511CB6B
MNFADRDDAGRQLADALKTLADHDASHDADHDDDAAVVVLGLPRGGVPVAALVAEALGAPLDVIMVRKLGVPFQPELGMGAIGEDGIRVLNQEVLNNTGVTQDELEAVQTAESAELNRRARRYRRGRDRIDLRGRTAIVVDDGLATGSTARAACRVARAHGAARVVLAVPVAPRGWTKRLADVADEMVCVATPFGFQAIGQWYRVFAQTTDEEVVDCLNEAAARVGGRQPAESDSPKARAAASAAAKAPRIADPEVWVQAGRVALAGSLAVPQDHPAGVVVFAHGSGSSRHSPRNRLVADTLNRAGLATLLFDLLTPDEEHHRRTVFDILLLARRLSAAVEWLQERPEVRNLPIGCFGASTGAAAALWAASEPGSPIAALVSRGGRPDLAMRRLPDVTAPTLFIVGGADAQVLTLNRQAAALLGGPGQVTVVPGATHLFPETGALEQVAELAAEWFTEQLAAVRHR